MTDFLRILLALAAVCVVVTFVAAIVSPRWADRYERFAHRLFSYLSGLAPEAGSFRFGETPVYFEGESGGGGGAGGEGGEGAGDEGNGGGAGGEGGQLLADAQAAIKALTDAGTAIPDALTKAVSELAQARKDAGRYRTEKNETGAKVAQLEEQFAKIAKHLGIKDETPEAIAQALTKERDDLAAENRTLKVGQALTKAARDAKADEDSLLDSRAFMAEVEKLDPSKDDFADELKKLVETAVKDNPKLKAQAARSGNDLSGGGAGNGDRPRSLEDAVAARLGG